ncbi:MAG: DUF6452 family protein [Bacteroidales bacterium]|nr:DUF6452 family protein [Bacteroidales bacterium]
MGQFLRILPAVGLIVCAAASCNTSGCYDNGSSIPLAGFYDSSRGTAISLDSLRISGIGAPADSALSHPGTAINEIYLPMHAGYPSTAWVIAYKWFDLDFPEANDTVTFDYESIPYFASEECGAMYAYRITRVGHTTHIIDSVTLTDSLITNADRQTIQIYFRTDGEGGDE